MQGPDVARKVPRDTVSTEFHAWKSSRSVSSGIVEDHPQGQVRPVTAKAVNSVSQRLSSDITILGHREAKQLWTLRNTRP